MIFEAVELIYGEISLISTLDSFMRFFFFLIQKVQALTSNGNDAGLGIGSSESAVLRLRVPPQQVQAQQSLNLKTSQWLQIVLTLQTMRYVVKIKALKTKTIKILVRFSG